MSPTKTSIPDIIALLRPRQWVKNLFVLLPMFFGGRLLDAASWRGSLIAALLFCMASSAVYCLNDVADREADRAHPVKRRRPVASGRVSAGWALALTVLLGTAAIAGAWWIFGGGMSATLTVYLALNIAYSLGLKHVALLDVAMVAAGFVLRLVAGGIGCSVELSPWIVIMVFLLSMFLALAKRRDDVVLAAEGLADERPSARGYTVAYLDMSLGLLVAVTVVCYILYTLSPATEARLGSRYLYATSVFVLLGMLRYLQIALVERCSGQPTEVMMRDRFILICLVCWMLSFLLIIYC